MNYAIRLNEAWTRPENVITFTSTNRLFLHKPSDDKQGTSMFWKKGERERKRGESKRQTARDTDR